MTGVCTEGCENGWFGLNCSQQCVGHCKDSDTCNIESGQCDKGCAAGWTGSLCNKGNLAPSTFLLFLGHLNHYIYIYILLHFNFIFFTLV